MRSGIGECVAELGRGRHRHAVRAFLAIPVRPPALEAFHALRARLVTSVPGIRWAPVENAHITLHFFGSITAQEFDCALGTLRPIATAQRPMRLRLRGLGSFPSAAEPRLLWCGVDGDGADLAACALACRAALAAAGFPVEDRSYRAHCTLGRTRQAWPAHARECWRQRIQEDPSTPSFTADRAILYESLPGATGARHVVRDVLPFAAAGLPH